MRIPSRTKNGVLTFRSAGVSPAWKTAGETPALRFVRRAIPWLAVAALAFAWSGQTLAETNPEQPETRLSGTTTISGGELMLAQAPPKLGIVVPRESKPPKKLAKKPAKKGELNSSGMTTLSGGVLILSGSSEKKAKSGDDGVMSGVLTNTGTLTITGGGLGQFPATLDQALAAALEASPKVMVAKANVTKAEAELSSAQMEVAGKIVKLWTDRQTAQLNYDNMLAANKSPGAVPASILIEAGAAVTQIEMELRCLIGQASASALRGNPSKTAAPFERPAKPLQLPRGPVVEIIRKALLAQTQVDFNEAPVSDVMDYLKETHKIEIQVDSGYVSWDTPITINLNKLSLGAFFQAFDDRYPDLKLVVRDYGILVTSPEHAREQGYFPVVDFARLADGDAAVVTPTPLRPVIVDKTYAPPALRDGEKPLDPVLPPP